MPEASIAPGEVSHAAELARAHPYRVQLGALAFDVISRQGQAGTPFAGREFVEGRAAAHGVDRERAETDGGNLVAILERGPKGPRERALVCAFAIEGLKERLAEGGEADRADAIGRFVSNADALLSSSSFDLYAFARAQLPPEHLPALWDAVADAMLADDAATPAARARNAARATVLAEAMSDAARASLARVAERAVDPVLALLARSAAGLADPASPASEEVPASSLQGTVGHVPTASVREVLRLITGIAVLQWLGRGLAALVGLRREVELALVPGGVQVRRRVRLMGRTVRAGEETYTLGAVAGAGRSVRYPALHLLVGLLALAAGVIAGGVWLFEGIASGETILLLLAAGAILLGGGLDLALDVLVPARRGRVAVDLWVLSGRSVRVARVAAEEAEAFLDALSRRLAR
ncbi:MAG: hypothetical protein ACODAU_03010 [Myxococcota bacterium]